jgi:MFS family permease
MPSDTDSRPWHHGVTRYQWLVLIVAALGWAFDAFEGQLYTVTREDLLKDILGRAGLLHEIGLWRDYFNGIFLLGSTLGGWLFASLADKWGRTPVMSLTILFYSLFSGLTALATEPWHVGALRFLVAMGVGGEWAVGAALVAEVFPKQARERASGIFHATSVVGLWLATATGVAVGSDWRTAFMVGVVPALLVLWVRISIREPESWKAAKDSGKEQMGSFKELLGDRRWRGKAIGGALLSMIGLATFWGVVVAGKDIAAHVLKELHIADPNDTQAKIAFGFIQTTGAGIGMLAFGPMAARLGRRSAFSLMHVGALVMALLVCWLPLHFGSYTLLLVLLPVFGFFAQGIHAGYAVYFPELFPARLRATGAGFCFNTGRILASPVLLWLSGWMKHELGLMTAIAWLSSLFLLGLVVLIFLPETKGQELPE